MHNGYARKAVSELQTLIKEEKGKDTFLDATVTSPPYFDLKDYGSDDTNEVGQHGSYIEYLDELRAIFEHVYSITNEDGSLWVVVNTFRRNHELIQLPFDIARVCQNLEQGMECSNCENTVLRGVEVLDGPGTACPHCGGSISSEASWILQDIVVWNKNKALPYTKEGRLRNVFEYVLCFSKKVLSLPLKWIVSANLIRAHSNAGGLTTRNDITHLASSLRIFGSLSLLLGDRSMVVSMCLTTLPHSHPDSLNEF